MDTRVNPAEYVENSYKYRGQIISEFSGMEKAIELMISRYFFETNTYNTSNFKEIILDRLTFEGKRTALRVIFLNNAIKNGFKPSQTKSHPDKELFEEIRKLNDERVRFAHHCVVIPSNYNGSVIGLADTRDNMKANFYTKEEIENILKRIREVNIKLLKI
jgi:hypothetical protein